MSRLSVWMVLLALALFPLGLCAQEFPIPEELFEETAPGEHAGLLGKRYVQAMYRHFHLNDDLSSVFDDSLQGFNLTLNAPVVKLGQYGQFGIDVFGGYGRLTMGGSTFIGPPINSSASLHVSQDAYYAAATLHTAIFETIRPFTQLGVSYADTRANFALAGAGSSESDDHTDFRLVFGTEADLTSFAALRCALDVETQDSFGYSTLSTEVILWPLERVFVRGGLLTPLNGDGIGGTIGAGFQF